MENSIMNQDEPKEKKTPYAFGWNVPRIIIAKKRVIEKRRGRKAKK